MTNLQPEVAAPGALFWETVTHPDNIEILEGDERTRKLPADRLKAATRRVAVLQAGLNIYWSAYIDYLTQQRDRLQSRLARLGEDDAEDARQTIDRINARIKQVQGHIKPPPAKVKTPYDIRTMKQAKEAQVTVWRLEARIDEHYRAVENELINQRLQDEMAAEINFYAQQIIDRWTALGYREEFIVDGKRVVNKVQFEEAHFTEDTIQFKVYVSHLTVLGSTVHHLPNGVRAWDLVKPETLKELEAACECPITSPHTTEDEQGFEKGCWLVVHRVGMRDGLFNYVELSKVIAKYNQALRTHFALPVGIKAGRQIEYLHLDKVPHLMINGITGSGKTNQVRVFLAVLSQFYSPDEIRFVLVDLKRSGDLSHFASVPHLVGPIIKDVAALEIIVPQLVALMHERMTKLSDANCFDIGEYNKKHPEDVIPRVLVLIDECGSISDLASSAKQTDTIYRGLALLAAQARAAGIHLMLGTQQPSKEAIPTKITNNVSYTISFRQRTTSGSMAALGNNRLKQLPAIKGRALVDNGFGLIPVQTPYATDDDLANAVKMAQEYTARHFWLPGAEDSVDIMETVEAEAIAAMQGVTVERIMQHALEFNNGLLAPEKIHKWAGQVTSRPRIKALVKEMIEQGSVTYEGRVYVFEPAGRGHRVKLADSQETQPSTGSDSGATVDDEPEFQHELRETA